MLISFFSWRIFFPTQHNSAEELEKKKKDKKKQK